MAGDGEDVLAVVAYAMNIHHHFKIVNGKVAYLRGREDTALVKGLLA
jgi:hypothetical protein